MFRSNFLQFQILGPGNNSDKFLLRIYEKIATCWFIRISTLTQITQKVLRHLKCYKISLKMLQKNQYCGPKLLFSFKFGPQVHSLSIYFLIGFSTCNILHNMDIYGLGAFGSGAFIINIAMFS